MAKESYTEPLTLDWIIETLKKDGYGTKQKVLKRIQEAGIGELGDLAYSIRQRVSDMMAEDYDGVDPEDAYEVASACWDD